MGCGGMKLRHCGLRGFEGRVWEAWRGEKCNEDQMIGEKLFHQSSSNAQVF